LADGSLRHAVHRTARFAHKRLVGSHEHDAAFALGFHDGHDGLHGVKRPEQVGRHHVFEFFVGGFFHRGKQVNARVGKQKINAPLAPVYLGDGRPNLVLVAHVAGDEQISRFAFGRGEVEGVHPATPAGQQVTRGFANAGTSPR